MNVPNVNNDHRLNLIKVTMVKIVNLLLFRQKLWKHKKLKGQVEDVSTRLPYANKKSKWNIFFYGEYKI